MSIQLEAYSPPDATAILRMNGELVMLEPPYRVGRSVNVHTSPLRDEDLIEYAVFKQGFISVEQEYDNWEAVFSFLREQHQQFHVRYKHIEHDAADGDFDNNFDDFDREELQALIAEIKDDLLPQQRFIYAQNLLSTLLSSDVDADLKQQAEPLIAEVAQAQQTYIQKRPVLEKNLEDKLTVIQGKLTASVERMSWDSQRLFLDWLKGGIAKQDWQVESLRRLLADEPLEMLRNEDWIFNLAAQGLKTAVILFEGLEKRELLKPFIKVIKSLDDRATWDDDLLDIAYWGGWPGLMHIRLPKIYKITRREKEMVHLMMSNNLIFYMVYGENIKLKGDFATLEMPLRVFIEKNSDIELAEKSILNSPKKSNNEIGTIILYILSNSVLPNIKNISDRKKQQLVDLSGMLSKIIFNDLYNILNQEIVKFNC